MCVFVLGRWKWAWGAKKPSGTEGRNVAARAEGCMDDVRIRCHFHGERESRVPFVSLDRENNPSSAEPPLLKNG